MGKAAVPTLAVGSWGRVRFFKKKRTLRAVEVRRGTRELSVAVRADYAVERWNHEREGFEEADYSRLPQNDDTRACLRVRCCYLAGDHLKLHHFMYYIGRCQTSCTKPTKKGWARLRARLAGGKVVVDHDNEKWWDFSLLNLVLRRPKQNAKKAGAATGTRPKPRKARR